MSEPHELTRERLIGSLIDWLLSRHVLWLLHLVAAGVGLNAKTFTPSLPRLPLPPPPPSIIKLFYFIFFPSPPPNPSPWEIKCQHWAAGTAVAVRATRSGGLAGDGALSPHSLRRLKLSAACRWPARILRGNCAFGWLNERHFPSPSPPSICCYRGSAVRQAVRRLCLSAAQRTGGYSTKTTGEFRLSGCSFLMFWIFFGGGLGACLNAQLFFFYNLGTEISIRVRLVQISLCPCDGRNPLLEIFNCTPLDVLMSWMGQLWCRWFETKGFLHLWMLRR